MFAGMIAIADQGAALLGKGSLDSDQVHSGSLQHQHLIRVYFAYHDVTTGNNGLPAGPGYDLVTGIGTPKAPQLLSTLSGNLQAPTISGGQRSGRRLVADLQLDDRPQARFAYNLVVTDTTTGTQALNVVISGSNTTSYTPTKPFLTPGHSYSWTVSGVTGDNQDGVASSPSTFPASPQRLARPHSPRPSARRSRRPRRPSHGHLSAPLRIPFRSPTSSTRASRYSPPRESPQPRSQRRPP